MKVTRVSRTGKAIVLTSSSPSATNKPGIGGGESAKMEKTPTYRYVTYPNIFALTFEKVMTRRV